MSNKEMTEKQKVSDEIRQRRWYWIGHVTRREMDNDKFVALGWKPEGHSIVNLEDQRWHEGE